MNTNLTEAIQNLEESAQEAVRVAQGVTGYPNLNRKALDAVWTATDILRDDPATPIRIKIKD